MMIFYCATCRKPFAPSGQTSPEWCSCQRSQAEGITVTVSSETNAYFLGVRPFVLMRRQRVPQAFYDAFAGDEELTL